MILYQGSLWLGLNLVRYNNNMIWKERWERITQNAWFKRAYTSIGSVMIILSFLIVVEPEPFLRFGYLGVFGFNLIGPGTLLIPTLSLKMNIWGLALASAGGMALNDSLSWVVGQGGRSIITPSPRAQKIEQGIKKYGIWALLFWSIMPIPFDFVGLIAGYLGFPFSKMFVASFLGKVTRFLLIGLGTNWVIGLIK